MLLDNILLHVLYDLHFLAPFRHYARDLPLFSSYKIANEMALYMFVPVIVNIQFVMVAAI